MTRPLHFSAFVMNTPSHIVHGLWRDPQGEQIRFNELDLWIDLAKRLDRGGFDAIFFADVVGLYGNHRGTWDFQAEIGLQIPSNDPMVILSALAANTEYLGLAFSEGPIQETPFNFARRVSTLDHASDGRIAWNIVTNLLGWENFSHAERMAHDDRYLLTAEYVDVVYKLWEGSWDDDALLADRVSGRFADPSKIHRIDHVSEHYQVVGPHLVAPSPQRTPVLFQAGSSKVGRDFAARNAEAQFIAAPDPENARTLIEDTRQLVESHGRRRDDIKFFQQLSFVVGSTEAEADAKHKELEEKTDVEGMIAHFGGMIGVDLGDYDLDTPLEVIETEGMQSRLSWLRESAENERPTLRDAAQLLGRRSRMVGTPEQIADQLGRWRDAGVDGVNIVTNTIPGTYEEFIDEVMPILRERGLAAPEPTAGTFRHKLFGEGDRLPDRHPAARYRGAFTSEPTRGRPPGIA
jgi:FMN-dependent oxidoreductase (nitrilotriacetate monooxygenase family)